MTKRAASHRQLRATLYFERKPLLKAATDLARKTIEAARGFAPTEDELQSLRDYPMSEENFARTEATERDGRASLKRIREGLAMLLSGLDSAVGLGGAHVPDAWKKVRPGGYGAELVLRRNLLAGMVDAVRALRIDQLVVKPVSEVRPNGAIDIRDIVLYDFDRAVPHRWRKRERRWRPPELASWSLLLRNALPDGVDIRKGLTAAEVLKAERLALKKRSKRRGSDSVHGSAWDRSEGPE